jgi:hypothetical protein
MAYYSGSAIIEGESNSKEALLQIGSNAHPYQQVDDVLQQKANCSFSSPMLQTTLDKICELKSC